MRKVAPTLLLLLLRLGTHLVKAYAEQRREKQAKLNTTRSYCTKMCPSSITRCDARIIARSCSMFFFFVRLDRTRDYFWQPRVLALFILLKPATPDETFLQKRGSRGGGDMGLVALFFLVTGVFTGTLSTPRASVKCRHRIVCSIFNVSTELNRER